MKYRRFNIKAYKGIIDSSISIEETPVPIIGVNESGKSSALEAIAHFDYRNDNFTDDKKWKFLNRYAPEITDFSVECEVEITQKELDEIRAQHLLPEPTPADTTPIEEEDDTMEVDEVETPAEVEVAEIIKDELNDINLTRDIITISRSFSTQDDVMPYLINGLKSERIQNLAEAILEKLPRIYYFDNFLERAMPNVIKFSPSYINGTTNELNEDQSIIEGAFSETDLDLREFFNNKDQDAQDTLISRVNANITKKVIADWRKMHLPEGDLDVDKYNNVKIKLKLADDKKSILVKIIETFPGYPEVTMNLSERSLGFRWFFNFSARKCFAGVHEEKFFYLIDEPGSYLHNSAQTVLLDALIDLSKDHPVVFSTHSEFLLDPEKININHIKVVQKEEHAIKLIPIGNATTKKHEGALSTLYNALKMRTPLETVMNKKLIITEGITDFYFWKPLIDIAFLPGHGAGNNRYLLSIGIGASKKYTALFDGDTAGNQGQEKYEGIFGAKEKEKWITYKDKEGNPKKLEKLISKNDSDRLRSTTSQTDIKQAITFLFFDKNKIEEFWKDTDSETKGNIQYNIDQIADLLNLSDSDIKQKFTLKKTK